MNLQTYIREEQKFLIFIRSSQRQWEKYDPDIHGEPESLRRGYVVAYLNGEIIENRVNITGLPPGTHYIMETGGRSEVMPDCVQHPRIEILHEASKYHHHGKYCTRIRNAGDTPFRIRRFSAFQKAGIFGKYRLSTISNDWFTQNQFMNWFNQKTQWISPGEEVADQDNFGFGNGFWLFEVEFETGEMITVKARLPNQSM